MDKIHALAKFLTLEESTISHYSIDPEVEVDELLEDCVFSTDTGIWTVLTPAEAREWAVSICERSTIIAFGREATSEEIKNAESNSEATIGGFEGCESNFLIFKNAITK